MMLAARAITSLSTCGLSSALVLNCLFLILIRFYIGTYVETPKHFRDHIKTNYSGSTLETSKSLVSKQYYQIVIVFRIDNTCSFA